MVNGLILPKITAFQNALTQKLWTVSSRNLLRCEIKALNKIWAAYLNFLANCQEMVLVSFNDIIKNLK